MKPRLRICRHADEYAKKAAEELNRIIVRFENRYRLISISGGSTPFPVYRALAPIVARYGMAGLCYWIQTDERMVSANDERSNQKAIAESLFSGDFLPDSNFAPLGQDIKQMFTKLPPELHPPAPIDLVILGTGTDGHTASLFPDTDWLTRDTGYGYAIFAPASQPEKRISLTLNRIMQAREVVFLVTGAAKQNVIENIFMNEYYESPAAYIARNRPTSWLLDPEAASIALGSYLSQLPDAGYM